MPESITEGAVTINIPYTAGTPTADMPVFYNPEMKENRDVAVAVLNQWLKHRTRPARLSLPLAGSGIRAARLANELPTDAIQSILVNDRSEQAVTAIRTNLAANPSQIPITISQDDAARFLLSNKHMDYIDIDPFGSPIPFLDAACKRITHHGLLAVTATDTAPLCGTYPTTCLRRYDSQPLRCPIMHELALRILIRSIQQAAARYDRAATPILCYAKAHYLRVYMIIEQSKPNASAIIAAQRFIQYHTTKHHWRIQNPLAKDYIPLAQDTHWSIAGPLYAGPLQDPTTIKAINTNIPIIQAIQKELSTTDQIGFYSIPDISRTLRIRQQPPIASIISALNQLGHRATTTHLHPQGIRTDADYVTVTQTVTSLDRRESA